MFTYLLTGSFGEYFLFYELADFILYMALAWRHRFFSCPRFFPLSSPGVLASYPGSTHGDLIFKNWYSLPLFPLTEEGGYFRFGILANHLASILPFPGHRVQTSVGFHSDPHSLLSPKGRPKLTNIITFLF